MVRIILSRPASDPPTVEFTPLGPVCPPDEPAVATALEVAAAGIVGSVANLPIGSFLPPDRLSVAAVVSILPWEFRMSEGDSARACDQLEPVDRELSLLPL